MSASIRSRVKIPGVDDEGTADFYEDGPKGHEPMNKTALREAERKYKSKTNLDLTEVVDFSLMESTCCISYEACGKAVECSGYSIEGKEGFLYFPSAIPIDLQQKLVKSILTEYIYTGNESNLDPFYEIPYNGLFNSQRDLITSKCGSKPDIMGSQLLRKLRWVTIGYRYNWTTKEYDYDRPHLPVPSGLTEFCRSFAKALGYVDYKAEAGIINFYQPDDTLTCHVDRSERNMEPPLISMSFGLDGIFLLGGETRDDVVHAIRVRSGDISVLSGKSRMYFHGIPRILGGTNQVEYSDPDIHEFLSTTRINANIRQVF